MKTTPVDPKLIASRVAEGWPKHDVFYSAATGKDGKIYLGLSSEMENPGVFARLIRYDPQADIFEEIADLGKLFPEASETLRHPHSKLHTSTCVGADGKIYAATHMTAPPLDEDYYHFWHVYNDPARHFKGSRLVIYNPADNSVRDFGVVSPKGGCRWMTYNPEREELYLTTFLTAHLMVIRLKTGEVKDMGRISQYDFMGPCYSACGAVYTTDCLGFIVRYDPKTEAVDRLPVRAPGDSWRSGDGNGVFHLLPGPDGVKLYGVGTVAKRLFEYDPSVGRHGQMRDLGPAWGEERMDAYTQTPMVRTMAVGPDGRVYLGVRDYASPKSTTGAVPSVSEAIFNIVAVDPKTGEKTDYGLMQAPGMPPVLTSVAATAAPDGTVYFATWKVLNDKPLQLILFNPNGVKPYPPPRWTPPPQAANPKSLAQDRYAYHIPSRRDNAVFVAEGTFVIRTLDCASRVPPIPRNECAVTAFAVTPQGALFGATSGKRSHLFCMTAVAKRVLPMNVFGHGATACRALGVDAKGRLYAGTMGAPHGEAGRLWMYDAPAHDTWLRRFDDMDRGEFSGLPSPPPDERVALCDLGQPVPGEGILAMTLDPASGLLHGLTWPGGKFFTCHLETRDIKVWDIFGEHIQLKNNISRALVCHKGAVYFSGHHGCLIRHTPQDGRFENTGLKIPVGAGREYLNAATAFAVTGDGVIYGGTQADGCLFRFEPGKGKLINLGKASSENRVSGVTAGLDGRIWALAGGADELVHLVRHDPWTGEMKDCGLMRAKLPRTWIVHRAEAIATGLDGEIHIGETDAISHLVTYFPPIAPPRACAPAPETAA
ncbi:MAG TPA: hypothetical protein P5137_01455 [Candidatus Brocadiia bacterium]|nr:hypothetical protein [Candidatus Brocadiia bacterium]